MAFELKPGQGTFFKNDKQGNESRPDYRGELNVDGRIMRISGWIKQGKKGKWMSLSVEEDKPRPLQSHSGKTVDIDSDVPW